MGLGLILNAGFSVKVSKNDYIMRDTEINPNEGFGLEFYLSDKVWLNFSIVFPQAVSEIFYG